MFILFEKDGVDKVLIGRHLFSTLDVDEGFGSFETFTDSGGVELCKNMYELQFDLMEWDRFNQSTYFTQYVDDNGTLLSLDPCQDSLKINAVHAQYDLSNYNLNVNGVSQILMSLATVIPDSSHVHILANGEIDFLENASFSVHSRTATQYDFYNAELYIHDANNFSGKATFDYVDLEGINQAIDFSNLVMNNQVLNGKSFIEVTDIYLFDSKGYEKSQSFDHNLIKNIKLNKELMLAGNIKFNDNLKNYEKISNYLDLSGGLETSGLKDKSKIDFFLNNLNKLKNET